MITPLVAVSDGTRAAFCASPGMPCVIIMFPGSSELLVCKFMAKFPAETELQLSDGFNKVGVACSFWRKNLFWNRTHKDPGVSKNEQIPPVILFSEMPPEKPQHLFLNADIKR